MLVQTPKALSYPYVHIYIHSHLVLMEKVVFWCCLYFHFVRSFGRFVVSVESVAFRLFNECASDMNRERERE